MALWCIFNLLCLFWIFLEGRSGEITCRLPAEIPKYLTIKSNDWVEVADNELLGTEGAWLRV